MTGTVRITLKSDLCAGSGEAVGATVNRDLCIRDSGFPYIPARRLKGCLLDAARWLESYGAADSSVIEALFGTNTGVTGAIRIRDALLPGAEAMEAWLASAPKPLEWAAKPLNVLKLFTAVRGQTRLENGVAADGSLRYTRVLARYNVLDRECETVLEASVSLSPKETCGVSVSDMSALLEKAALAARHIGSSRNRGLGYVKMEWIPDPCDCDKPEARTKPEISPAGLAEIRYVISLDAPVSLPGNGTDCAEIPARSVIGCVSAAYLRTGDASDALFRDLFLNGSVTQWSALTPVIDGERAVPAPLSLVRMKNGDNYRNLLTDSVRPEEKRKRLSGYYAVPVEDGFLLAAPDEHTKYHHSHGDAGTLYMQDSLDAGMLYGGTVTLPSELAARVLQLLEETDFAFGRSRSAQYAACSLYGAPEVVPVYKRQCKASGTLYAVLESDLALVRNGVYVADNASVREALAERLGIKAELSPETPDYCQYRTVSGFQERWHLQKPQIPAVRAGSVYCFQSDAADFACFQMESDGQPEPRYITLGEFQEGSFRGAFQAEGFGRIRIYTAEEMSRRVVLKKWSISRRKSDSALADDNADAVEKLETALTVSAGLDALRKSVRTYYRNLRKEYRVQAREKGAWIQTGTIGRLRLMLAESKSYEDFLKRIDGMKESDVHSQKKRSERDKALELAQGLCGKDGVSAEAMLTCSGETTLLEMILACPAAREQIEEHWKDAMRYLLYIAYYDRKAG